MSPETKKQSGFAGRVLERIGRADPRLIEAALQQYLAQKQLLEVIFENLQEGLVVTDSQLRILTCNARARRWLGIPPRRRMTGESLLAHISVPEIFQFVARTDFSKPQRVEQDFRPACFAGITLQLTSYPVESQDGSLFSRVFVLRDVTETRRAELRERQAERIASLATLTAGIAHELKNPLNSLQIHAQLTNRMIAGVRNGGQTVELDRLEASLRVILEETRRMTRIVDEFLGAVRPTDPEKAEVALRELVEKVARMFLPECRQADIALEVVCDADLPPILLDSDQIERALVNVIRNAIEAILEKRKAGDGTEPAKKDSIAVTCRIDGDDALIEVVDTGCGIAQENLGKVFEPYYTTKFSGTGLGLMNVYRILREHDGKVEIESEVGRGTRVRMRLPLSQRPVRLLPKA